MLQIAASHVRRLLASLRSATLALADGYERWMLLLRHELTINIIDDRIPF
jgi:hypothetical protein